MPTSIFEVPLFSGTARRGSIRAKVFLARVAQPDAQDLGDLFAFGFAQAFVKAERCFSFSPAGAVVVGIPQAPRCSNPAARLFEKCGPAEGRLDIGKRHGLRGRASFSAKFRQKRIDPNGICIAHKYFAGDSKLERMLACGYPPSMIHPLLYEINARQWLAELSRKLGKAIDLSTIPEEELLAFQKDGFTHLWLMGVWPTGPRSQAEALRHADLRKAYGEALPGWTDADVLGSPYAVAALYVAPMLGGDLALASLRSRLNKLGIKLVLDFVPNHLGLDHEWLQARPHLFVGKPDPFRDSFPVPLPSGEYFLAHGKDPYFPGWTDTVQLDYRRKETRQAMGDLLESVAQKCDGVRCDMAMLVLSDVFHGTWAHVPLDVDLAAGEFWRDAITKVKFERPDFLFLAEAYWGLEGRLCDLGFDYAYDKTLYDFVIHDRPWDVQAHLLGLGAQNQKRAHFLENHDEPRIAGAIDLERHRAALTLGMGLPGMRFLHDGQFEGVRRFARVQLARRAVEPLDHAVSAIYESLLPAFAQSAVGNGDWHLLTPHRAWADNPTSQCFTVVQWQGKGIEDRFDLVVVNMASHRAQCRVTLSANGLKGGSWRMEDQIGCEKWIRSGDELISHGLFLDVAARGAHLFSFERE